VSGSRRGSGTSRGSNQIHIYFSSKKSGRRERDGEEKREERREKREERREKREERRERRRERRVRDTVKIGSGLVGARGISESDSVVFACRYTIRSKIVINLFYININSLSLLSKKINKKKKSKRKNTCTQVLAGMAYPRMSLTCMA